MNDIMRDIVAIAMAIIGLAMLAVIIKNGSNTATVIGASTSGFANLLGAATKG